MGAEVSKGRTSGAPQIKTVSTQKAEVKEEDKKKLHLKIETSDGIMCSCGYPCGTEHLYNLHIECHCPQLQPIDPSGWPERHFETVPFVGLTQRGVVSQGNVAYAAFTFSKY